MFKELYESLPPLGQLILGGIIVIVGAFMALRGWIDRKKPVTDDPRIIPMWVMIGPVHDALQSVHNISEESRTHTAELKDMGKTLTATDRGQEYTHYLLEAILRNQEMREDFVPPGRASNQSRRPKP